MALHWVDIGILAIIVLSIITGLVRGFVKECIAFSAWILAIWLAFNHAQFATSWLQGFIKDPTLRTAASIVLVFVATLFLSGLINMLVGFFMKRSGLSGMDRLLGMGFGFARGIFIVSLILVVIKVTAIPITAYEKDSFLYARFTPVVHWLSSKMPHFIAEVHDMDKQHNLLDLAIDVGDLELVEDSAKKPLSPKVSKG